MHIIIYIYIYILYIDRYCSYIIFIFYAIQTAIFVHINLALTGGSWVSDAGSEKTWKDLVNKRPFHSFELQPMEIAVLDFAFDRISKTTLAPWAEEKLESLEPHLRFREVVAGTPVWIHMARWWFVWILFGELEWFLTVKKAGLGRHPKANRWLTQKVGCRHPVSSVTFS